MMHLPAAFAQPITGQTSPGMSVLDQVMQGLLSTYSIPGAALAVSRKQLTAIIGTLARDP